MARVLTTGLDAIIDGMESIANIPEKVLDDMLNEMADTAIREQKTTVPNRTGELAESISKTKIKRDHSRVYLHIYPKGGRPSSGKKVTNNDVGFIYEFGAPQRGILARQWMRIANENAADEAIRNAEKVYENYLNKLGL